LVLSVKDQLKGDHSKKIPAGKSSAQERTNGKGLPFGAEGEKRGGTEEKRANPTFPAKHSGKDQKKGKNNQLPGKHVPSSFTQR